MTVADRATNSPPLALTDAQMDAIMLAAKPLPHRARRAFLEALATDLRDRPLGDGAVHRAIRIVQRRYFDPPNLAGADDAEIRPRRAG
jgi:hypothetical protein